MPANYPPIAPRGPSAADRPVDVATSTDSFNQSASIVSRETADGERGRLVGLERVPSSFIEAHHPMRDAVTIALQKPAGELIKRHAARQRMMREAMGAPPDSDDPTERPMTLASDDGLPSIIAVAETMVAMAVAVRLERA